MYNAGVIETLELALVKTLLNEISPGPIIVEDTPVVSGDKALIVKVLVSTSDIFCVVAFPL